MINSKEPDKLRIRPGIEPLGALILEIYKQTVHAALKKELL